MVLFRFHAFFLLLLLLFFLEYWFSKGFTYIPNGLHLFIYLPIHRFIGIFCPQVSKTTLEITVHHIERSHVMIRLNNSFSTDCRIKLVHSFVRLSFILFFYFSLYLDPFKWWSTRDSVLKSINWLNKCSGLVMFSVKI